VEHPVTEAITGLDLVEWQLRVAAGEHLPLTQQQIQRHGHAIEVRVCAEDPAQGFVPSAGHLDLLRWPEETQGKPSVRVDAGFETGDTVPALYDSLLGKIIAYADSREAAVDRLIDAVSEFRASGVATNASWLVRALGQSDFRAGDVSTAFVARHGESLAAPADPTIFAPFAAAAYGAWLAPTAPVQSPWDLADGFRMGLPASIPVPLHAGELKVDAAVLNRATDSARVRVNGTMINLARDADSAALQRWHSKDGPSADVLVASHRITVWSGGESLAFALDDGSQFDSTSQAHPGSLTTPLPGVVVSLAVKEGDTVKAGQTLLVIEAMKMEHAIKAPRAGIVKALKHGVGDRVREGSTLAEIE
jgi:3-methylcrotonyl-CoA carboxylase alpha subunit